MVSVHSCRLSDSWRHNQHLSYRQFMVYTLKLSVISQLVHIHWSRVYILTSTWLRMNSTRNTAHHKLHSKMTTIAMCEQSRYHNKQTFTCANITEIDKVTVDFVICEYTYMLLNIVTCYTFGSIVAVFWIWPSNNLTNCAGDVHTHWLHDSLWPNVLVTIPMSHWDDTESASDSGLQSPFAAFGLNKLHSPISEALVSSSDGVFCRFVRYIGGKFFICTFLSNASLTFFWKQKQ